MEWGGDEFSFLNADELNPLCLLAWKIQSGCHLCSWTVPDKAELLGLLQQPRPGFEFVGDSKAWSRPVNSLTQAGEEPEKGPGTFSYAQETPSWTRLDMLS